MAWEKQHIWPGNRPIRMRFPPRAQPDEKENKMEQIEDPLYEKAVSVVLAQRRASISLVQRTLLIGYNRAARLFESMEKNGVVSTMDHLGNRKVLKSARSQP